MASVGQISMARCAAPASSSPSGCLKKYTAVSSSLYFKRLGASSRQTRQGVHVVSTYQGPGTFCGCLLFLSAIVVLLLSLPARGNAFSARRCRPLEAHPEVMGVDKNPEWRLALHPV